MLKRSSVNSIVTAKFNKCGKKTNMRFFSRKVSNAQEKVWGMLKAEFMKWIFRFAIIKLRLQLRYLAYEQSFKTWDKLLFMPTRDTLPKSELYTSGKYADFTKPGFLSFSQSLNKFLDCGASLSRAVRFDLCPTNPTVTVSFGRWAMQVSRSDGLRCDFSTNKLTISMGNMSLYTRNITLS